MLTREQAMSGRLFHMEGCKRTLWKRGGTKDGIVEWRRNGKTKTWKTRPKEFSVPVKHGLRDYGYITERTAVDFHVAEECPLADERLRTTS